MSIVFPFGQRTLPNFSQYAYYSNVFTAEEIDNIRALWDREEHFDATVSGEGKSTDDELRRTKLAFIPDSQANAWVYERLGRLGIECNNERYGFDLLGFHHQLQLARYGAQDFFDWHLDFGAGEISQRKLSISVQLSDPDEYEGGDFQFMINQKVHTMPREKGTVIIFPSFILHRVTPITKGVRQSIVAWLGGPPYR
ncbi:2OG-Fe(II) oxygenase [Roseivirga pacifica]|uniref:2OG-Fe(II) oxygenase n=1 Tax=Roseivirga pacifica TaxID=1267423 RepID=UPI00227D0928|nr:2OG-Fe(II) oxygenase [Roseivirga pacifica]